MRLADDEPQILRLAKRMLERLGFDVLVAKDGVECVDIYMKDQLHEKIREVVGLE